MPKSQWLREPSKTLAEAADKHKCYQRSVQDTKNEVVNLKNIYMDIYNEPPYSLREDFCGTAILCEAWIRKNVERSAIGVDIDASVIEYGKSQLKEESDRIELMVGNVLNVVTRKVDIIAGLNYGVCYFHERSMLVQYLKKAAESLNPKGILVCDVFGGSRCYKDKAETIRDFGDFKYVFEQRSFDLMTNRVDCRLHFKFPDGSALKDVFRYHFRLWSIAELKEAFMDAGFKRIHVWVAETHREDGEENFIRVERNLSPLHSFNAYIVGSMEDASS